MVMKLFRKVKPMSVTGVAASAGITVSGGRRDVPAAIDMRLQNGYLTGQLLVATPVIHSGLFARSVIYMLSHSADGAMGLIINQPIEVVNHSALLEGINLHNDAAKHEIPVFFGGPLERSRGFVIHSAEYFREFSLTRTGDLAVTASSAILNDMAAGNGPENAALAIGYAGWNAGQLEAEIVQNSWISVPATEALVFGTENDLKWAMASKSLGIDMAFFSTTVGHA